MCNFKLNSGNGSGDQYGEFALMGEWGWGCGGISPSLILNPAPIEISPHPCLGPDGCRESSPLWDKAPIGSGCNSPILIHIIYLFIYLFIYFIK